MWKWLETLVGVNGPLVLNKEYKRARTKRGRYKGDDKSTTFNEAWVSGRSPKKWIYKHWKKLTDWWFKDFYGRS